MLTVRRHDWVGTDELPLNALEEALLWMNLARADHDRWKIDERVRTAMDYLAAHVDEPFELSRLAAHCGLSVSRLSHLFKDETGVTLQQYSEDLRLREARQLLTHTSLPMKEIATASGFNDAYYFSKRFRRSTGVPPTEWRARRDSNPRPPA
jgi:AraC family transcriptional regulator of arabinose operon